LDLPIFEEATESAFHTRNDPHQPFERENVIERKGRVDVRCEMKDIAHGYYSNDNDAPCSLLVLEFRFAPNGIAHRIKEAHVVVKFAAMQKGQADPEVSAMYPEGDFCLEATHQREERVRGAGLNVGGGFGLQAGGDVRLEKTTERLATDTTRVRASIDLRGRNWGPKNSASFTFLENKTAKTGVVSSLQAAILLKRRTMDQFKATVTMNVSADTLSNVEAKFKSPKDDDIWFDPERKPTNRLRAYDVDNLGAVELKSLAHVTHRTFLADTVKHQAE